MERCDAVHDEHPLLCTITRFPRRLPPASWLYPDAVTDLDCIVWGAAPDRLCYLCYSCRSAIFYHMRAYSRRMEPLFVTCIFCLLLVIVLLIVENWRRGVQPSVGVAQREQELPLVGVGKSWIESWREYWRRGAQPYVGVAQREQELPSVGVAESWIESWSG